MFNCFPEEAEEDEKESSSISRKYIKNRKVCKFLEQTGTTRSIDFIYD
jgi:hypothetical protein